MKITIEKTKGYTLGKNSGKSWVAEMTGGELSFLEPTTIDYGADRHWFRRDRATRYDTYEVTKCGLYIVSQLGERHYRLVFSKADGTTGWTRVDADRAKKIDALILNGMDFEEARKQTKPTAP